MVRILGAEMTSVSSIVPEFCAIAGGLFGVAGAFLMANRHINVRLTQIPGQLIYAFAPRSQRAVAGELISDWTTENALQTLRGLALIAIGFLFQTFPPIWNLLGQ
jgi:hypothetical protein